MTTVPSRPGVIEGETGLFEIVVGLEVHCELSTRTKLFCGCANAFGAEPNTNVCPVCLGLPGSLPVLNRHAVELAMRIGTALGCTVKPSVFHRKNYFYPDMPKDYQVSQYDEPINVDGSLELPDGSRIGIVRAHMEEDTGKTTHIGLTGRIHGADYALVDYNRAGVPLVEIVSAPDIRGAEQAKAYVSELRAILVATGASDGRMEEGSLRVDANVSVRQLGSEDFGTRCEIKNLNSMRSLARAIEHEATRQIALIEAGEPVVQETRHWHEDEGRTSSMRSKEEAFDYRYFQEPDLVPLDPERAWIEAVAASLPMLPAARRRRLLSLLEQADASVPASSDQVQTVVDLGLDDLVVAAVDKGALARLALARAANEAAQRPEEARRLDPACFARLCELEATGALSSTQAKAVLAEMLTSGGDPGEIARRLGFEALGTDALARALDEVLAEHGDAWARYLEGDDKVAQFLLGQVMRATRGRANGKVVAEALQERRGRANAGPKG
jgi:aspartyl-tRNA(Asn)/glutamyl-tRNA(Gln) amidotransferase subunit B